MVASPVELLQFPYSHFNEKARWALDYKGVRHRRTSLLPGPHVIMIRRLTGQTHVPVVRVGNAVIPGSARIVEELERRRPQRPLYPKDPELLERALKIQSWFDEEIGPKVRRALFSTLLGEGAYVCRMLASLRSAPIRWAYRASFPIIRVVMKKDMGITGQAALDDALAGTRAGLDFVAERASSTGYLVGDQFSVADLTAAALLAPAANPPASPMHLPEPRPASVVGWHARWVDHPAVEWVREQYRRHRPPSAAL